MGTLTWGRQGGQELGYLGQFRGGGRGQVKLFLSGKLFLWEGMLGWMGRLDEEITHGKMEGQAREDDGGGYMDQTVSRVIKGDR